MDENKTIDKESELMTNRQLSQLCAKGFCEWCFRNEQKVHNSFEYLINESDFPVSDQIILRPFEKIIFTNADENTWYKPTKDAYASLINCDRTRHILGF